MCPSKGLRPIPSPFPRPRGMTGQLRNTWWGHSATVETGALVHAPTMGEMASWRTRRLVAGVLLLIVAITGAYIGAAGAAGANDAGGGGALVTLLTVGASGVIGAFGLRYLLLGLRGKGLRLYQRALEADFPGRLWVIPERRLVPLLRVEVSGTAAQTRAMAISSTGHAFLLPAPFVEKADVWTLGSLGLRPVAPGGRAAKELRERGELEPVRERGPEPPYHGPPWPETPPLPKDLVIEEQAAEAGPPGPPPPPPGAPPTPGPSPAPPALWAGPPVEPAVAPTPPPVEPSAPPPPPMLPSEPSAPPPEPPSLPTEPPSLPTEPPTAMGARPRIAPPAPPEPPTPSEPREAPEPPEPPVGPPESAGGWELEELPPSELPKPPGPASPDDGWELEELPPPTGMPEEVQPEKTPEKPPSKGGWEWEEL